MFVCEVRFWVWIGVGCPCPLVRNDIVNPRHLFYSSSPLNSHRSIIFLKKKRRGGGKKEKKLVVLSLFLRFSQFLLLSSSSSTSFFPSVKHFSPFLLLFSFLHFNPFSFFFQIAETLLYKRLCPSVGPSAHPLVHTI